MSESKRASEKAGTIVGRHAWRLAYATAALLTSLPFWRGIGTGQSFYFRDLSLHFFPLRRFAIEGLLRGELRYWNPYINEGVPLSLPPVSYWGDLLQVLLSDERGFSLLLALHLPLAGVAFVMLARFLGIGPLAATLGGLVFSLGGFALSSLNLYVYAQALAWSPLVILTLLRAADTGGRRIAVAAIVTAAALSTTGLEIVGQAIACGLILWASGLQRAWRAAAALALASGLAAPTLLVMRSLIAGTARGAGFSSDVVLAHSVHPLTLLQVLVGNLYCDLSNPAARFWGNNFFPRGFPYVLSLYLGVTVVALAILGASQPSPWRGRLVALAGLGLLLCLGRWGPIGPLVDFVPAAFRVFRYPTKAFFSVHLSIAMLAALGLQSLAGPESRKSWRRLAPFLLALGGLLALAPSTPRIASEALRAFAQGFFPPDYPWVLRLNILRGILADTATGGFVALAGGLISLAVVSGRLRPAIGSLTLIGLVGADLLRTGAGLNPTVTPAFFDLSPQMSEVAASLRAQGGRVFTCDVGESPAYRVSRGQEGHEVRTFAALRETLTPLFNLRDAVPSAYGPDLTMLVPLERLLPVSTSCARFDEIAPRLRAAAVSHVLSLDVLDNPELSRRATIQPPDIAPLAVHIYALRDPAPRVSIEPDTTPADGTDRIHGPASDPGSLPRDSPSPGRIVPLAASTEHLTLEVEADRPVRVTLKESYAPGWTATVDGRPAALLRADGGYQAVPLAPGRRKIVLRYRPPGLLAGLALALAAAAATLWLWRKPTGSPEPPGPGGASPEAANVVPSPRG